MVSRTYDFIDDSEIDPEELSPKPREQGWANLKVAKVEFQIERIVYRSN